MTDFGITREGGRTNVTLSRELTVEKAPQIQLALKQEMAEGANEIVFDLSGTESLDSAGICLLIAACNSMYTVGGTVRLVGLSNDIFKLLKGMKLADCLNAAPREASNG